MKLIIVRHGDPDYVNDNLTEKGKVEVQYLAERLSKLEVRDFYVSPKGRARATAQPTLERMGRTAQVKEWLREFDAPIRRPDSADICPVCWDWLPQDWAGEEIFYDKDHWFDHPVMQAGNVKEKYEWVVNSLDELLRQYGYVRENNYYRVEKECNDTIVFFCHFGLECVLLSHLVNVSPMVLWHGFCALPSTVTEVVTEERRPGIASFRTLCLGDQSHLYAHDEPAAFSARFRECYGNEDERRD